MSGAALERLESLRVGARRIADPEDALGREARRVLPRSTGLSPEGVELALSRCLEVSPTRAELDSLVHAAGTGRRAWVLLSSNVFVAAHRAIALGLASSEDVRVRASRREPEMARLLHAATGDLFQLVSDVAPEAGDDVWAYGSDETMDAVERGLPSGVVLHKHGAGMGIAAVAPESLDDAALSDQANRLALDVVLFDQRGCLSPRVVLVTGSAEGAERFTTRLAERLSEWEHQVPRGTLDDSEAAAATRYRETIRFTGQLWDAGAGAVGLDLAAERMVIPPPGRHVHVMRVREVEKTLRPVTSMIAAVGVDDAELSAALSGLVPAARQSRLGQMQTPAFDGPVDRRGAAR